jgi:hypothetical protein
LGGGSGSIPRSRVSVEVSVDFQKSKPCSTVTDVETIKEETMGKKHTYTIDIKTKARFIMLLRKKLITFIIVASLVFGLDGGAAPLTA